MARTYRNREPMKVCECGDCMADIVEGETYYEMYNGDIICEECMNNYSKVAELQEYESCEGIGYGKETY